MMIEITGQPACPPSAGLGALLAPRVIAVVGASRNPAKWGRRVLEYTIRSGFAGRLYGVNPVADDLILPGVTVVSDLADIGESIDLAVVALPAAAVPAIIDQCAALHVGAAVVTAAGFGESDGKGRSAEEQMRDTARAAGMRLLGPNTFGLFIAEHGVTLTPREHIPCGDVALISQSGNVAVALYEQARQAGIGFSAVVGVGNQSDVAVGDLLDYFAHHGGTKAIGVYVEGLRSSGTRFRSGVAACRSAGKPVVVIKAGRSGYAARAVATHTGTLASDDRVWESVLADHEVIRVHSTQELTDTLSVASRLPRGRGRVVVLADGGGDSIMALDAFDRAGIPLAEPTAVTRSALDEITPPAAPRTPQRNPVTLDTAGGLEDNPLLLARCAGLAAADDGVDIIVVSGLFGGYPRVRAQELACAAELIAIRDAGSPIVVQSAFANTGNEPIDMLSRAGIPVLSTINQVAQGLRAVVDRSGSPAGKAPPHGGPAADQPGLSLLGVDVVATLLREHGVSLPPMTVVYDEEQLDAIATTAMYPACLKIADPAVVHKSDVGGVRLRLADGQALHRAAADLWGRFPDSPLLVMPSLRSGTELLIGTGSDPVFGPFVLVGRGGIWAESDPDVAIRLAPLDACGAVRALQSLRCAPTFTGGRGTTAVDLAALAELVVAMSQLAAARSDLSAEINPVIAYTEGYGVADFRAWRAAAYTG